MADTPRAEPPHDILAAEAFPVGPADPALHQEPAHDVLAADAFAMPAPDRRPLAGEAHDVLAADQFAFPAGAHRAVPPDLGTASSASGALRRGLALGGVILAGWFIRRRRRG